MAQDSGLTVLPFLKLGVGARPASIGEAYVSVVADASATFWNPAGLLRIESNDVMGAHHEWIQDLRHEFVSYGAHRGRHGFGISFIGLYTDDIEGRDETGAVTGHFGYSNSSFSGSYAFQVTETLGLGATARYVRESLVATTAGDLSLSGFAFDFGATWRTPVTGVMTGATVRHLGSTMSYDFEGAQDFDLPTALQVGVSYERSDLRNGNLTVAADFLGTRGEDASFRFGAEYAYLGQFLLGAGYKTGLDVEDVSFGVGYDKRIRVHYAFTPISNDLGSSHRISLGYGW
jgi:hypothetical protein